jgi:hypothetical protein
MATDAEREAEWRHEARSERAEGDRPPWLVEHDDEEED